MANINIAQYKRPGIFINEIDDSVRQIPDQEDITLLITGFSRKGPINRPVLITTPQELLDIFGDIDRSLEKKGSFFHRTILNVIRSAPVWALNLLKTDDQLDQIDYKSISLSSNTQNDIVRKAPYENFFDRSDFWYRDTDSFLSIAEENKPNDDLIFHLTNMSDRKLSVFIFKSQDTDGLEQTLETYYGSSDQVPAYLNSTDLTTDYMVSVLIVAGDWSDFETLSVDTRWSQYFNKQGLRTDQITNFRNDSAVNTLRFYDVLSLIPFFRDVNDRDIFIETAINTDTDRTGLFSAFDIDKLEDTDYPRGLIDLVGSNLVGNNDESIEFLSYKETVVETLSFKETVLDRAGNSFGHDGLYHETKMFGNPSFIEISGSGFTEVTLNGLTSYILDGQNVEVDSDSSTVVLENSSIGRIRKDTLYVDSSGALGYIKGFEVSNQTTWDDVPLQPLTSGLLPIAISYVGSQGTSGNLGVAQIEVLPQIQFGLIGSGTSSADIQISYNGINEVIWEFTGTSSNDVDFNYRVTKMNMIFEQLQSNMNSGLSIIRDINNEKIVINNLTLDSDLSQNKKMTITVLPSININNSATPEVHYIDDELSFKPSIGAVSNGIQTQSSTSGFGIASENSTLYNSYVNGQINSGDFFYPELFDDKFERVNFFNSNGNDTISINYNSGDLDPNQFTSREIRIFGTLGNDKIFTVLNVSNFTGLTGDYDSRVELIVNESVSEESVFNGDVSFHGASDSDIRYLKMYLVNKNLFVEYTQDQSLIGNNSLNFALDFNLNEIKVFSGRGNLSQTLEIEQILENNSVLVNAERYGEIKVGDYLQAYVDESSLQAGEAPKRITRIVEKLLWAADPTLVRITTDAQINVTNFGTDAQTTRYTTIDDYVNTYQPSVLSGFRMRQDSIPDGTEERQSCILDLIAVGTPIFKGLVNRNKIFWRYLIDPWGNGLTSNSKQQLVDLCGERLTALGILNMPSVKQFKKSQSPSFIDPDDKTLRTDFIRKGGDPESNPSFLYNFGQGKGQSNVGYFFPFLSINDNGRPLDMPPSSFVANTFMRKHTSRLASVKPWTIAAGIRDGFLTGFGNTEIDLNPEDIENLNLMNANPIVYKRNRNFVIETNNTAQVTPRSSLSFLSSREVLIELEEEMYQMLLTYQWRFNTAEVRAEIKANADTICERFVRENGLFNFVNIMDESNNTSALIDAQIGVIDTYVEVVKGLAIIVNNVTILKTGDIDAGGFR